MELNKINIPFMFNFLFLLLLLLFSYEILSVITFLILLCLFPILVVGFSDKINDEINPNVNMLTNGFLFLYSLITGLSNPNFLSFCTFMVFFWIFIHLAKLDNKKLEFKIKIFLILKFLITSLIFSMCNP